MRGQQNLEHASLGRLWHGNDAVAFYIPRTRAAHQQCPSSLTNNRRASASSRIAPLPHDHFLLRGVGVEIDGPGIAHEFEPRPILTRGVVLAYSSDPAGPRILDRRHVGHAHGVGGGLQNDASILRPGGPRDQHHKGSNQQDSWHVFLRVASWRPTTF